MLKLADKKLFVYKGDYKPVEIYKNNQKVSNYKTMGMSGTSASFKNTYNAPMTAYGKSGYYKGKNLCPPLTNIMGSYEDDTGNYSWNITVKEDGRFDVSGAMITGVQVSKITLSAGTYTASGCGLVTLWWEGIDDFLSIPNTFTLEEETDVSCVVWYNSTEEIFLEDQYIQIEKGSKATAYVLTGGNSEFPPSIDNKRRLESAEGTITVTNYGGIKNTTYSFDIPELAGLEVTKNSSYNYTEKSGSNNYYFISDSLSGNTLKRNIGKLKLSGEENFSQKDIQSTTHNCFYCDLSHLIKRKRTADACMCNCFETRTALGTDQTGVVLGQNDANLYFIVDKKIFSTLESFVSWIAYQYSTCPVTLHYVLDSEVSQTWTQVPFVSFPLQTQIQVKYKSNYPKCGLTKCILIHNT